MDSMVIGSQRVGHKLSDFHFHSSLSQVPIQSIFNSHQLSPHSSFCCINVGPIIRLE